MKKRDLELTEDLTVGGATVISGAAVIGGATVISGAANVSTLEITTNGVSSFIMTDVFAGTRVKIYVSGGTLTVASV